MMIEDLINKLVKYENIVVFKISDYGKIDIRWLEMER